MATSSRPPCWCSMSGCEILYPLISFRGSYAPWAAFNHRQKNGETVISSSRIRAISRVLGDGRQTLSHWPGTKNNNKIRIRFCSFRIQWFIVDINQNDSAFNSGWNDASPQSWFDLVVHKQVRSRVISRNLKLGGGGYRKMLGGCKHARSANLHWKTMFFNVNFL